MRSYGPNGTALAAMPTATRRTASARFRRSMLSSRFRGGRCEGTKETRACQGPQCAVLDTLKLVDGSVHQSTLARLRVASEGRRETSDDPGLNVVLGEIGLRVAVELGKVGVR